MTTDAATLPWVRGTVERTHLDATSWVDVGRGWLRYPEEVYSALAERLDWRQAGVYRYDHLRPEPRLSTSCRPTSAGPHPAVLEAHRALRRRYGVEIMPVIGLSRYRDGHDAMRAHRDSGIRWCESTVIAVLTLGATRPWVMRPAAGPDRGGRTSPPLDLAPAAGDLLVLGGRAQADSLPGGTSRAPRLYGSGR